LMESTDSTKKVYKLYGHNITISITFKFIVNPYPPSLNVLSFRDKELGCVFN
jgi:hypothetical protein